MRRHTHWLGALGVSALIIGSLGCGKSVYPVKGKILFEGKPMVGGGSIAFVPLDKEKGKAPGGMIEKDGTYTISTYGNGDGARVGEFQVLITQSTAEEPEPTPDGKPPAQAKALSAADRIPTVYATHQSPLKAKVEAKSPNEINFELKRSDQPSSGPPPGGA